MQQARQRPSLKDIDVMRALIKRFTAQELENLSTEEFNALRRLFPNFQIVLFVAKLANNVPTPFPQSVLLKKTDFLGFKWGLPIGLEKENDESFQEAVARVGKELIGEPVRLHSIIGVGTQVGPFGLVCLVIAQKPIRKSDVLQYFHLAKFPWGAVIPGHKVFINSYSCGQMRRLASAEHKHTQ